MPRRSETPRKSSIKRRPSEGADRFKRLEQAVASLQRSYDASIHRIAALQAQVDHLVAKLRS